MRNPPRILIADDNPANVRILRMRLAADGHEIVTAGDGEEALAVANESQPDLILLDVMMPKIDGIEVCRRLKKLQGVAFTPIILVTAMADAKDVVAGLDAGADEYLTKPVDHAALSARVHSMLRIKSLHDTVTAQAEEIARWNATLARRVDEQVAELERVGRLKRFFSPQLADLIVGGGAADPLRPHRREICVVFLDLRGFTAFAEASEPEEVSDVLAAYHAQMGRLILEHEGTLERFTGDGMMIFFNDPVPVANPEERAIRMAEAMRRRIRDLGAEWRRRGYDLDLSIGIAKGYATIGAIGFEGRQDYAAIGSVTNLASRLCAEASPDQILVSQPIHAGVAELVNVKAVGPLHLKGFRRPITAYELVDLRQPAP
ncbi:MAG: adenylate/guanylate cyclase domain-containing response regulator [Candidatus Rokuibacteriota bacterium]|nr:MAG: adenylate/guanylate cyclase domain-containing response regulator [Candidatus Rokubacteria bacterium]